MLKTLLKAGTWVFIGISLGRFAGFIRESFLAANFGTTAKADIAVIILTLPDVFLSLLVGGALGAALIPEFKRMDTKLSWKLFIQVCIFIALLFIIISTILMFNTHHIVNYFGPGLGDSEKATSSTLLKVVIWSIPITALTAVLTAYLQSNGKYAIPAMGTLIFNVVLIAGLALPIKKDNLLLILACVVVVAAFLRLFSQLLKVMLKTEKIYVTNIFNKNYISKNLIQKYIQAILAAGLLLLLPIIGRVLSSYEGEGSMAIFNYYHKLVELPLASFLTIFSVVLFPKIAEFFSTPEFEEKAIELAKDGLTLVYIFSISIAINYSWFSIDYARLMFGWGIMPLDSILVIGSLASVGLLALPAQGLISISMSIYNARQDMKTPFYISFFAVLLYLPLSVYLAKTYTLQGLVIALVVIYWLVFILHMIMLYIKHNIRLFKVFFNKDALRIVILCFVIYIPIFSASYIVEGLLFRITLSLFGMLLSMLVGVLSVERYKKYIFDRIQSGKGY